MASGEKMYGKRIVSKGEGPDKKGKHHIRHAKRTHKSKGKAGTIPHTSGMSPHSGARKNKLQTALEAREKKVAKQRKKSKGSPAYTAIGLAAGAVPFAGAAGKAIPAIVKGVKTIKAGMRASKAKNPRGAMKQINPKSSLIKPKTKVKKKNEGEQYLKDLESGGYQEKMMEPPNMPKSDFQKALRTIKKRGGGRIKGYKKGGPITYRMTGGQVVDNSYD